MKIVQYNNEARGTFRAIEGEAVAGEMTYSWAGSDKLIIDHTEVKEAFNGQGVGKKLLLEVVAFAREKHIKIVPLCPFAKSMFDRMPEIGDVLFQHS